MGRIPKPPVPPWVTPERSIALLRCQIERLKAFEEMRFDDPEIDPFGTATLSIIDGAFGRPDGENDWSMYLFYKAFHYPVYEYQSEPQRQQMFLEMLEGCAAILESCIEKLKGRLTNPSGALETGQSLA